MKNVDGKLKAVVFADVAVAFLRAIPLNAGGSIDFELDGKSYRLISEVISGSLTLTKPQQIPRWKIYEPIVVLNRDDTITVHNSATFQTFLQCFLKETLHLSRR